MMKKMLCLLLLCLLPTAALAAEPEDEEAGYPLTIEDATATEVGEWDVRLMSRYEHARDGDDRLTLDPEFETGIAKDVELNVTLPFDLGSADDDHGGNLGFETLYNFLEEKGARPALAVSARADLPTGDNAAGIDTTTRFLATRHLLPQFGLHALHFNAAWTHNAAAGDDARDDLYQFVVGSSHGLDGKTALVTDFVREQDEERGQESNLLELGFRREIAEDAIASIGAGAGLGDDSPDMRVTFGLQKTFK